MTNRHTSRGLVAVALNAIVLAPALAAADVSHAALMLFFALVSAFAFAEARAASTPDRSQRGLPWRELATGVATLAIFVLALLSAARTPARLSLTGGTLLMSVGVVLRYSAMRALGSRFVSEVRAAPMRALVSDGIYARVRHPSETGLLAITLGACVLLESTIAGVFWAALVVPLVLTRVRREDRALLRCFGPAYADYCRRVRALL